MPDLDANAMVDERVACDSCSGRFDADETYACHEDDRALHYCEDCYQP